MHTHNIMNYSSDYVVNIKHGNWGTEKEESMQTGEQKKNEACKLEKGIERSI